MGITSVFWADEVAYEGVDSLSCYPLLLLFGKHIEVPKLVEKLLLIEKKEK